MGFQLPTSTGDHQISGCHQQESGTIETSGDPPGGFPTENPTVGPRHAFIGLGFEAGVLWEGPAGCTKESNDFSSFLGIDVFSLEN